MSNAMPAAAPLAAPGERPAPLVDNRLVLAWFALAAYGQNATDPENFQQCVARWR